MDFSYTILIPLIPLAVFLLLGINYNRIKPAISGWIGSLGLLTTLVLSYYTAYQYFFVVGKLGDVYQSFTTQWRWMNFTDTLYIDMGVLIDQISVMMLVVVSTISFADLACAMTRFFARIGRIWVGLAASLLALLAGRHLLPVVARLPRRRRPALDTLGAGKQKQNFVGGQLCLKHGVQGNGAGYFFAGLLDHLTQY